MFDKLDDILIHYEELMQELGNPSVTEDQNRFRRLMKEQADLAPLVETYTEYKKAKMAVEDSLTILDEENDEEMREMAKEELSDAKKQIEALERAVESTELLMKHSSTTYLEVLTAQQSLLSAQLSQIADRFDEIQGVVNLYQALGGGRDMAEEAK